MIALFSTTIVSQTRDCHIGLIFALDTTSSLNHVQVRSMRTQLAEALIHPEMQQLFDDYRVSLYVYEWAGRNWQDTIVPWTEVGTVGSITAAELLLEPRPIARGMTAIGESILYGYDAFLRSDCWEGVLNLVIDGFGGGDIYYGIHPKLAREQIDPWFPINGVLVGASHLEEKYRDWILQGPAPFIIHAESVDDFGTAIKQKIVFEIALLLENREMNK